MNKINKIKEFFSRELSKDLQDVLLLEVSDDSYLVFGKYSIVPKDRGYEVRTIKEPWRTNPIMSDLKIAVAWCTFDKYCMAKEIKRLPEIDVELSGIKVTLAALQKKLNNCTKLDDRFIYLAKIQENKYRKSRIIRELNQYIFITKRWQKEKFEEFDPKYS